MAGRPPGAKTQREFTPRQLKKLARVLGELPEDVLYNAISPRSEATRVTAFIDPEVHAYLFKQAGAVGLSVTEYIRLVLLRHLLETEHQPEPDRVELKKVPLR